MKKVNNMGFFLVETMVVIAVVGIVLTYLFKTFSSVYTRFNMSEYYNTVAVTNAAGDIKQYIDKLGISYEDIIGTNAYVDITDDSNLTNDYYAMLKSKLKISNIYLINVQTFFDDSDNLNSFKTALAGYLKTLEEDAAQYKIIVVNQKNEYGSISAFDYYLTLTGNANDEYAAYVPLNGTFTDPGYESKDNEGNNLEVTVTGVVSTSTAGIYYLNYNVGAISMRRKVVVYKQIYNFDYTGNYQVFTAPVDGKYQIETWGAEGGTGALPGGKGGYTIGSIYLMAGTKLYVYVGGAGGTSGKGGYNGGGNTILYSTNYGGGGGTDVRLVSGRWNDISSLRSRIMVAGGGGGAYTPLAAYVDAGLKAGPAGGLTGSAADVYTAGMEGKGGTQISGGAKGITSGRSPGTDGAFGEGGTGAPSLGGPTVNGGSGGGGGYYGGGSGEACSGTCGAGGGGGSSFISGYTGCNATTPTGSASGQQYHYSGYQFINTQMIAGNASMPNPRGAGNITGNTGNGYAKITLLTATSNNSLNKVRYIYNQVNGNTANGSGHWMEIQAFDKNGTNIALNKTVTTSYGAGCGGYPASNVTDGVLTTFSDSCAAGLQYVTVDLGAEYDLSSVQLWHINGRTYYQDQTKVAGNDLVYRTIGSTDYLETANGFTIRAVPTN